MGRKQQRKSATVQLVQGQDDDLIQWLGRLPNKSRNGALKFVLRTGLDFPQPQERTDELNEIKQELEHLKRAVQHIPQVTGGDWNQRVEQELINIGQWINHFQSRLESLTTSSAVIQQPEPVIEAVPELSESEQQQRKSKLKKATW